MNKINETTVCDLGFSDKVCKILSYFFTSDKTIYQSQLYLIKNKLFLSCKFIKENIYFYLLSL